MVVVRIVKAMSASRNLRIVKVVHTIVWAIFAASIFAIPIFAWLDLYHYVVWLTVLVLIEIVVLAANGWQCPLTRVAARFTDKRQDNFDIYLPLWLARYNKLIFGSLFVVGQVFAVSRWYGWIA